jgi:hypothetical protein
MNAPRWSEERIKQMLTLWNEGHSGGQIARIMGVTRSAVMGKIGRMDVPKREGYAPHNDRVAPVNMSSWDDEKDAKLRQWYVDDLESPETISLRLNLARSTVARRLKTLNIPIRGRVMGQLARAKMRGPADARPMPKPKPGQSSFVCLGESVGLMDLTSQSCRWPQEQPGAEMRYCGRQKDLGPYCYHHARLAIRPKEPGSHKARRGVDFRPKQLMNGRAY